MGDKAKVHERLGDSTFFEIDAAPQFFAATDEELKAAFPMWQPLLSEPVERWFENPFTKQQMFGRTRVPEHVRKSQPRGWKPDLTHLPRSKRVPVDNATVYEFFDDGRYEEEDADYAQLEEEASDAFPLYEPADCSWDVTGILPRWIDRLDAPKPWGKDTSDLIVAEVKSVLRAMRPGQRLFFVDGR